ncbi:MAG: hypothetical protein CEN87_18 [Parcubacteria group bacterium Licking1014_1]|nr:MAG: hypothetical protein CEN87_18 [Parcubacteria group bacterium Licking1014_1]
MEQYPVPQFIEQEGKITSFISFRQFFYLLLAGIVCFVLYQILPFFLFMFFAIIIAAAAIFLAFVKINGEPALNILLSSLGFFGGGKNYTWKKKESPYPFKTIKRAEIKKIDQGPVLKVQQSRLRKIHTDIELRTK